MSYMQNPLKVGVIGCGWFAQEVQKTAGTAPVDLCDFVRQSPQER